MSSLPSFPSSSNKNAKKRKEMDTNDESQSKAVSKNDHDFYKEKILQLESELLEKDKKILDMETELFEKDEKMKDLESKVKGLTSSKQQGRDEVDDDAGLSEDEMDTLDSSNAWDGNFLQLREFRMLNGHCNVPGKVQGLGKWVQNQRFAFKKKKLSAQRVILLERLGFTWGKNIAPPLSWEDGFKELQKYKNAMGHCNIRVDQKNPTALAKFVACQRAEYKRFSKDKDSLLDLDKIGQLNKIGFMWKDPHSK